MQAVVVLLVVVSVTLGILLRRSISRRLAACLTLLSVTGIVLALGGFVFVASGVRLLGLHPLRAALVLGGVLITSGCLLPVGAIGLVSQWSLARGSDRDPKDPKAS